MHFDYRINGRLRYCTPWYHRWLSRKRWIRVFKKWGAVRSPEYGRKVSVLWLIKIDKSSFHGMWNVINYQLVKLCCSESLVCRLAVGYCREMRSWHTSSSMSFVLSRQRTIHDFIRIRDVSFPVVEEVPGRSWLSNSDERNTKLIEWI